MKPKDRRAEYERVKQGLEDLGYGIEDRQIDETFGLHIEIDRIGETSVLK